MAAPYSRSRTAAGKTAAMSTSTSFRWRAITARSGIGDKSSGAFSVCSRIVRANVPSSDVSSPKARAQKASNGARLSSVRNGIGLIWSPIVGSRLAEPEERFFVTLAMAAIVAGAASQSIRSNPRSAESSRSAWSGYLHLDRRHPQLARRLEVAADVVEERDARRRHAELAADELVDPRVGLSQAHHRRLDEDVEVGAKPVRGTPPFRNPVVREGRHAEPALADPPDCREHPRPGATRVGDSGHEARAVHLAAVDAAVGLERRKERLDRQLAAFESRPRARLTRGDDGAVDGVGREPVVALVAGDRVERRLLHDAADVEHHRLDRAHGGIAARPCVVTL